MAPKDAHPPRSARHVVAFSLALAAFPLLGCPPRVPPQADPTRILEWTLGPQNLASPTSPDAFLLLIPREKLTPKPTPAAPKPAQQTQLAGNDGSLDQGARLSACIRATSVLPAPREDGRVFLAVDGVIHVLGSNQATTPLGGAGAGAYIDALLAARKVSDGLEILVSARAEGDAPRIRALVVDSSGVVRVGVADLHFDSPSDFFATYTAPRCTRDGKQCIKISRDDETSWLEKWSAVGGSAPETFAEVFGARDAAWSPTEDGSVYVLKSCP